MRIAVTGRKGQVALSLIERAQRPGRHRGGRRSAGRSSILTQPASIGRAPLPPRGPIIVVSAAAYTAVDQAEDEPDLAFAVNAVGAGAVAEAAARIGVPVIHLSTDYVFDGERQASLFGRRPPGAAQRLRRLEAGGREGGRGGQSASSHPAHGLGLQPLRHEFREDDAAAGADRDEISVVSDQWGNPTSAA